jgi:hypothetical protein
MDDIAFSAAFFNGVVVIVSHIMLPMQVIPFFFVGTNERSTLRINVTDIVKETIPYLLIFSISAGETFFIVNATVIV